MKVILLLLVLLVSIVFNSSFALASEIDMTLLDGWNIATVYTEDEFYLKEYYNRLFTNYFNLIITFI